MHEIEEEPLDTAIGPSGHRSVLAGNACAVGIPYGRVLGIGQFALRHRQAAADGPVAARRKPRRVDADADRFLFHRSLLQTRWSLARGGEQPLDRFRPSVGKSGT